MIAWLSLLTLVLSLYCTFPVVEVESTDIKEEIVVVHEMVVDETVEVTTHESPVKTQQPKEEIVRSVCHIHFLYQFKLRICKI